MESAYPLPRERNLILAALLLLAAAAWSVLIWQARGMDDEMGLTMGMGVLLFLAIWIAMMVAMMFPSAAPMVLTFARVQSSREERGQAFVPTWLFVLGYLVLWTLFGALAYLLAIGAQSLADRSAWIMDHAAQIGGVVLIVAGIYQISPLKWTCLTKCRTPMTFILASWHDGPRGALRMGFEHGAYCLGCCWLLFVILFPLGVMNIGAMALITIVIFAEKSMAIGLWIARAAALALVLYGVVVLFAPDALPTMM